jgi:hypothetical protein
MRTQNFTIRIRRDIGREIKPEAEQIDGKTYAFRQGWVMDENDPYPGEEAWIPHDPAYPVEAPCWIARGDLA